MAQFLRDIHISNLKITEDAISHLVEAFVSRATPLAEKAKAEETDKDKPFLTFIIRFDGKGYRLFSMDEVLRHFRRADKVERLIIAVETLASLNSNRNLGHHLELRLDTMDANNCFLSVTSDDADWVDSSYSAVQDVLNKNKTKNGWARSGWSTLTIQLSGVVAGFGLSLWAASRISPFLAIENAFVITFFFALLLFSNAWTYINSIVLSQVHRVFPNIQFYRPDKDRINWIMQAVIGGVATAIALYLLNLLFGYIGGFISEIPR